MHCVLFMLSLEPLKTQYDGWQSRRGLKRPMDLVRRGRRRKSTLCCLGESSPWRGSRRGYPLVKKPTVEWCNTAAILRSRNWLRASERAAGRVCVVRPSRCVIHARLSLDMRARSSDRWTFTWLYFLADYLPTVSPRKGYKWCGVIPSARY